MKFLVEKKEEKKSIERFFTFDEKDQKPGVKFGTAFYMENALNRSLHNYGYTMAGDFCDAYSGFFYNDKDCSIISYAEGDYYYKKYAKKSDYIKAKKETIAWWDAERNGTVEENLNESLGIK